MRPTRHEVLTLPNMISVIRLVVLVPIVIWLMREPDDRILATIALAVFGATDWIDGFIARRWNMASRVGAVLDPVADRLGIAFICAAMTVFGILPVWMLLVIVLTDFGLGLVGATRMHATQDSHVTWLGKIRTALIMTGLPLLLLGSAPKLADTPIETIALVLLSIGVVLHLAAGIHYALMLIRLGRQRPAA
ncbi:CDP-alcohol phosphatidyltransferase family protein [Brevibacterium luteolum]|uniref:CDP-alcohol phosphatidyltransferase family protein n=1 Tax=Brevibacterium luteolum TaxID=199591 RepID=UPI001C24CFA3|nr:CDP-alcohol phosphatidyltransferase family protein [Brevibacterium luteolum]MBU8578898.1 CDP-alcohol phosphatidyltransferase family protein [Brevibacterium luteolum]